MNLNKACFTRFVPISPDFGVKMAFLREIWGLVRVVVLLYSQRITRNPVILEFLHNYT